MKALKPKIDARRFQYRDSDHTYWLDGHLIPGVTGLIDPLADFEGIPENRLEAAKLFSSHFHKASALYDKGTLNRAKLDPALEPFLESWIKCKTENGFKPELIELPLCSESWRYGGTLDKGMRRKNKRPLIIDIKNTYRKSAKLQMAAYCHLLVENFGWEFPDACIFVPQPWTTKMYHLEWLDVREHLKYFLSFMSCHTWALKEGTKTPKFNFGAIEIENSLAHTSNVGIF